MGLTNDPISLPMRMRGGLSRPAAISRVAEQCAIICATSIFPHCRSVAGCSLSMRAMTSSITSCWNRFFILAPSLGLRSSKIIALARQELSAGPFWRKSTIGALFPMNPSASREKTVLPAGQSKLSIADQPYPRMNRVLFLLGLSVLINYIDRSNLSIAAPLIKDELGISGSQLGTLLSAFFYTYALLQIPAGWLVDRFDVKWVFALGLFIWSAATAVTGVLHGFVALLAIRVVLGVGESVAFPAYGKILGGHFQEGNRGFANSVIIAGLALGPAVGMLLGGNLVGRFGWRSFFVILGLAGLLWLVPWLAWMPRRAPSPPRISDQRSGVLAILRQRSAWGTCLCQFSFNYASYFLVTWLPFYLMRARGLSMAQMAKVGGFVYVLFAISSTVFGKLSDRWVAAEGSPTRVRKTLATVGNVGMGIFLAVSAIAPDTVFIWMLALAGG